MTASNLLQLLYQEVSHRVPQGAHVVTDITVAHRQRANGTFHWCDGTDRIGVVAFFATLDNHSGGRVQLMIGVGSLTPHGTVFEFDADVAGDLLSLRPQLEQLVRSIVWEPLGAESLRLQSTMSLDVPRIYEHLNHDERLLVEHVGETPVRRALRAELALRWKEPCAFDAEMSEEYTQTAPLPELIDLVIKLRQSA